MKELDLRKTFISQYISYDENGNQIEEVKTIHINDKSNLVIINNEDRTYKIIDIKSKKIIEEGELEWIY